MIHRSLLCMALIALIFRTDPALATRPWTMEEIREFERNNSTDLPPFELPRSHREPSSLDDPAYFVHFQMLCDFLVSMQFMDAGQNHGGMIEGESGSDHNIIETDNTQEAIREWSQYAVWTGDTGRYHANIDLAKMYCGLFPAWHEGDGGLDFYSAHNCGWGFEAVRKYREAYNDTTWNWYADSCAAWMNAHSLSWSGDQVNAYAEALGLGGMYFHAGYRGRQDWIAHCVNRGRALRTWLEANPARMHQESWALCGGTAVWGLTESLFAQYPDSGAMWVAQWGDQVQVWESAGSWNHSYNAWYANAQHRMFELTEDSTYWNNAVFIGDSLIGLDTDDDGGIMPGIGYPNTNDHSWVSAYMGWMGMERVINTTPAHDGMVVSFISPDPDLPHLAGDPLTVAVQVANSGRVPIAGRVVVTGPNDYSDSADVAITYGADTVLALTSTWQMPDNASLPDSSTLLAVFVSAEDENPENDSLLTAFDIRHGVQIFGSITDAVNPAIHVPATVEVYHGAYPDSAWTSFQAPAEGNYASGPRPLLEGANRIVVKPAIEFIEGDAQVNVVWESSPQQVDFSLAHTELALVDDDVDQMYETWFMSSLDSFPSLNVRLWNRSLAEVGSFASIPTVVWFRGNDSVSTLEPTDQTLLQNYLTSGGNLLLSGQNITEDEAAAPFLTAVLQCSLRTRNTNVRAVNGVAGDPITDGVTLRLQSQDGAWNQNSPSSVYAIGGSTEILHYTAGDDEACGVSGTHGNGRYVFLSFGLEAASAFGGATPRDEFLGRCFAWFGDSTEIAETPPALPTTISLAQNFPNPFNPSTTIRFVAPPTVAPVSLIVYNLLGQEVRALYGGLGASGEVTVVWDGLTNSGETATSGMYVYRLRTARGEFSRPLQLLR